MSGKKKVKQKSKGIIKKEVLEIIPDAEERFQEAFEKLSKRTKKSVEKKSARALEEKRKIKGMQARTIHKRPFEERKKYHEVKHQEHEANRHKFALELLTEKAEIEVVNVESDSILKKLGNRLYDANQRLYKQIHGRSRPRSKGISVQKIKDLIIAPFKEFTEDDDLLLTVHWNITGGLKEYSKLLKKHHNSQIDYKGDKDEPLQFVSYMIYSITSREVKYDSLASRLFRETKLKILPKKIHHSDLNISLDEYTLYEREYGCAGDLVNEIKIILNSSLELKFIKYNGYVDSFHEEEVEGKITFSTSQENTVGNTGSYSTYVSIIGSDGNCPIWPNSHGAIFKSEVWLNPDSERLEKGTCKHNDGFNDKAAIDLGFDFSIGEGPFSIGIKPENIADLSPVTIDGISNDPNELILQHFIVTDWLSMLNPFEVRFTRGPYKDGGFFKFNFTIRPDTLNDSEKGKVCFDIPVKMGGHYYEMFASSRYSIRYVYENNDWGTFDSNHLEYIRGDHLKEPIITFQPSGQIPVEYNPEEEISLIVRVTNNSQVPLSRVILLDLVDYNREDIIYVPSEYPSSQSWDAPSEDDMLQKGVTYEFPYKFITEGIGDAHPIFHIQYSFHGVPQIVSYPIDRDYKVAPMNYDPKPIFVVSPRTVEDLTATSSKTKKGVTLTWTANTDAKYAPPGNGLSYKIFRDGNLEVPIATKPDTGLPGDIQYEDEGVEFGEHIYQISVVVYSGESAPSEPVPESEDTIIVPKISSIETTESKILGESKLSDEVRIKVEISDDDTTLGLIGNKNTKEFHIPSCIHVNRMKDDSKVMLESITEAKSMGYNGCHWCLPEYDTG